MQSMLTLTPALPKVLVLGRAVLRRHVDKLGGTHGVIWLSGFRVEGTMSPKENIFCASSKTAVRSAKQTLHLL